MALARSGARSEQHAARAGAGRDAEKTGDRVGTPPANAKAPGGGRLRHPASVPRRARTLAGVEIIVRADPDAVAVAAAERIAAALSAPRPVTLGLAGGGTPAATYRLLVDAPIDWHGVTLWLGDERWVPPDSPESNARMARETFVDAVGATLLAPDHAIGDPERAAAAYAAGLAQAWAERDGLRAPDLVLLGMGDDGHTASLFPSDPMLEVSDRSYAAGFVAAKRAWRLTATMPLLHSARELVFLVTGEAKAGVLTRILEGGEPLPAQLVAAGASHVTWLVDAGAASELSRW